MKRLGRVKDAFLKLGSQLSSDQSGYVSPWRLFLIIIASVFIAEIAAMVLVYFLEPIPYYLITLIDAGIMVILICPILYLFSFRPLIQYVESLRRSEQKVKLEQSRLQSILATMPYGIYIVNQQYDVEYVNPVIEREFGPVAGQKCHAYLHGENEACAWCKTPIVFDGESTQWEWFSPRTGKTYEAFDTPFTNSDGSLSKLKVIRDITARKSSEEMVRMLSSIIEQTADTVVVTDCDGRIQYVNQAFEQLTGYQKEEAIGLTPRVLKSGIHDGLFYKALWDTVLNGQVFHGEIANRKKNGKIFHEVKTITPLRNEKGDIVRFVATGKDITAHKVAEQKLYQAYADLELRIQERTQELRFANSELEDEIRIRRQAEEALQQSEQRLNRAQEIAHLGSWELDLQTDELTWSDEVYRIFGLEPQEFDATYDAFLETVHPEDRQAVNETYLSSIRNGQDTYEIEHRVVRHSDGEIRIVHEKCEHFRNEAGEIIRSIGMVHDITGRKKAEEALQRFQLLSEHSRDIMLFVRFQDGHILEANAAAVQAYGYSHDELLGLTISDLRVASTNDLNAEQMANADKGGILFETIHFRRDGSSFPVEVSSQGATIRGVRTLVSIIRDITERKQAEDALRLSEENFSKAFQSSPAALLITRIADGLVLELNDAYSRIVGYQRSEFIGHRTTEFNIFIHENDRKAIIEQLLTVGSIRNFETSIRDKSGSIRYVVAAQELITFDDEACILTSLEDITELKEAAKILQRTNRTLRAHSASNQAMLHAGGEVDLLNEVCKIVVEDCGHAMVWIGYAENDAEKSVRPVAHAGFEEGYLATLGITWADTEHGRGPTGTAIRTGKTQSCRNILTNPLFAPWREQALERGYASSIVLPLVTKSSVLGAINIYSREPDAFAPDEADLLNELALDLTQGIEMIRLREAHELTTTALRESEERFRLALSHAPVSVAVQDRSLHYTWAYNQRTSSPDEIIGKTDAELFPDEAEQLTAIKLRVFETGENASEQLWVNSNNNRLFLDLFMEPLKNETGEIVGVGLASVDLTALKLAEEELRLAHYELELRVRERTAELATANLGLSREIAERLEIERQLRIQTAAMDAAANGIIITDPNGFMLWTNPAMTQISGYAREELIGQSTRLFNSSENGGDFYNQLWGTILAGKVWHGEMTNRRKDGSCYIEEETITPVRNEAGELSHFIAIKQDVSERKLIYAQLEESNRELTTLSHSERQQRFLAEGLVESSVVLNMSLELHAVLDRIFEQTRRIIPYVTADIVLIDGEVATIVRQWWTDEYSNARTVLENDTLKVQEFPFWEQICRTKSAVMVQDTGSENRWNTYFGMMWIRSYLGAPLIYNDQIVGIINLLSDQVDAFRQDMAKTLQAFAAPAAVAIQNARLYETEQQNRKIAEILSAASVALAQTLDTQMVMETILDYVQFIMPFDITFVVLNEGDERYRIRAARTGDDETTMRDALLNQTIDMLSEPIIRSYFTKYESTIIPDAREFSAWHPPLELVSMNCWLGIPLESMGKILGIVVIAHTTANIFTKNQIQLAEAVVKQAVVALQNAWLFEQVRSGRERLQQLSRHLVEIQENERKYIARELHDETSQSLTSLKMGLQVIEREADRRVRLTEQVKNLQALADETLESLHHLAVNLRPASLDHLGLADALTSLIESTKQRSGLQAHFKIIGSMKMAALKDEIETSIYRIVQESITNVVRHAHATYVDVILEWQDEKILIVIEDDGVGMDMQKARETGRLGLIGMQERAEMLGGRLLVDSTPDVGTTLVVEIPYANSNPYRR